MRGFWKLTWVETKVFLREPLGVVSTLALPVLIFIALGGLVGSAPGTSDPFGDAPFNLAVLAALLITVSAVISLVAIISIYREGGILKRLRATPLSSVTLLSAHVFVKLLFTVASLVLLILAGRRFYPESLDVPLVSFTLALLLSTVSVLTLGFVIASLVPTARFAQPMAAGLLYSMLAVSGLFFPLEALPAALRTVALALPTTHAVGLMEAVWEGAGWLASWSHVLGLILSMAVSLALSRRYFRWE